MTPPWTAPTCRPRMSTILIATSVTYPYVLPRVTLQAPHVTYGRAVYLVACRVCRGWFLLQGLSVNQKRLLYMLSLYTHPAETEDDKERWIRQQALMVLIYEGVVARVFDYDYAPSSEIIEGRRNWFNMSQVTTVVDTVGCALVQLPH